LALLNSFIDPDAPKSNLQHVFVMLPGITDYWEEFRHLKQAGVRLELKDDPDSEGHGVSYDSVISEYDSD
jgi:hypothetical protein